MFRQGALAMLVFSLVACGGGGSGSSGSSGSSSQAPAPSVSLTPATSDLLPGGSLALRATISGSASPTDLVWSVDNIAGGNDSVGTISGSGDTVTYLAPASDGTHLLQASFKGGGGGSAHVRVKSPVSVTLSPTSATVTTGATQSFSATVSGSTNTAVSWTVDGISGGSSTVGTVSGTGSTITYTAPGSAGSHTLTATSAADTTKTASASISVQAGTPPPAVAVSLTPASATVATGGSQAFTATVSGSTNGAVTWYVDGLQGGSASAGTISGTGSTVTYTAPTLAGNHSVSATSQADTSKSASSAVTVSSGCAPAPTSTKVVNAKDYGAKGDGVTDDTAALQNAVNAVAGSGGTLSIPDGTYMVNALTSVYVKSGMTVSMSSGAVLKAIPNGASNYAILALSGVSNVNIVGGTIYGERAQHTGTTGEWGMGLKIVNSSQVAVDHVLAKECWGDGFYVAGCKSVTLCDSTADHNRRQGLTITSVDGMVVRNCTFTRTQGTLPEDGIDFEPNPGETVNNVLITGCNVSGNSGFGIEIGVPLSYTGQAWITGVVIDSNVCSNNGANSLSTSPRAGIEASDISGQQLLNNTCNGNGLGILLRNGANGFTVKGNTTSGNSSDGIQVYSTDGNVITGNTSTNNGGHGIYSTGNTNITISGNTLSGNAIAP